MEKDQKINIGSEWRKWDLHVHSPASFGFSGTLEEFESQIKNSCCDVIGINDYFSVAGYKELKEKIDNGTLDIGDRKILPVVEFRMTESVQNKNTTTNGVTHFNFHIIFDDSIKVEDVENLIKGLMSNGTAISSEYDDKNKLQEKKISFEDLLEKLNGDEKFKDKYLLWLPYDEYGGIDEIDPKSDGWIKENYIKRAAILGSSRQKQIDFFLWKSDLKKDGTVKFSQEQFQEWFLCKKPCIKGSDSHSQDYPIGKLRDKNSNPIEKYCWIKADKTFEGLKQIVYEPETRVNIGEEKPKQPINVINSISLQIDEKAKVGSDKFCFAGKNDTHNLSPYFNCFIGGRGSGKSTLLNFLGLHSNDPKSSDEFWKKLSPSFIPSDGKTFSFQGTEIFEFLAQSEIETFAKDKARFTQAIYDRANSYAGNILEKNELEIETLKDGLDEVKDAISGLKVLEMQKSAKEKEKRALEKSVKVLSSKQYTDLVSQITDKSKELQDLEEWKNFISDFKSSLVEFISENKLDPKELMSPNKTEYENAYTLSMEKIKEALEILKGKKFENEKKQEVSIKKTISDLENKAQALIEKAGYTPESVEQIKSAPQKIIVLDRDIKNLITKIESKNKVIATYAETVEKMKAGKKDYEAKISEILKPLQEALKNQFEENQGKDIKQIYLEYFFDEQAAWESLASEFYEHFYQEYHDSERKKEVCDFIIEKKQFFLSDTMGSILGLIRSEDENKKYIKFIAEVFASSQNFQIFQTIRGKHLHDVKTNKVVRVKYDDKDIEHASFGQRCTAVVVILLLFGNNPLIIDEPEAHLDSSLIANYLVPLLKKKKSDRQIIFATHNANFVINGDAEKIFILKNNSGVTEIIETTIEDVDNREELLKLEGGKEAFEKRREKLNISRDF
ncbi:MAG TPA: AAA family ATPase [Patescibacteria group bacterium]